METENAILIKAVRVGPHLWGPFFSCILHQPVCGEPLNQRMNTAKKTREQLRARGR
jgi:hypothetical protein